jgi:hypothetical protein
VLDDRRDQLTGQCRGCLVALGFGEVPLEDRVGGPLAEIGLEHGCEREATSRPSTALLVSLRRHRRSR